jgi:hypothetical protein
VNGYQFCTTLFGLFDDTGHLNEMDTPGFSKSLFF